MSKELEVFSNDEFSVRTLSDPDGTMWFVAKDIAQALEYSEESNPARLFANVPDIWKGVKRIHLTSEKPTARLYQDMLCLTEQGVYFFFGRSDKRKALPYQMWIAGDVVPSIRKHGVYLTPHTQAELLNDPDLLIRLAQALKSERQRCAELEEQAEMNRPKGIFADALDVSKESILIGNLAKVLRQNGVEIGQTRLFAWLREKGYLMNCKGEHWNFPTQMSVDKGLFEVKTRVINNPDGSTRITHTTKVTGKGQIYLVNKLLEELSE